jgi:hypothetical protein
MERQLMAGIKGMTGGGGTRPGAGRPKKVWPVPPVAVAALPAYRHRYVHGPDQIARDKAPTVAVDDRRCAKCGGPMPPPVPESRPQAPAAWRALYCHRWCWKAAEGAPSGPTGPASLFRGKLNVPISIKLTQPHHAAVTRNMTRLGLTRSDFIALLIDQFADVVTAPPSEVPSPIRDCLS